MKKNKDIKKEEKHMGKKSLASFQIFVIVTAIFAFIFLIGESDRASGGQPFSAGTIKIPVKDVGVLYSNPDSGSWILEKSLGGETTLTGEQANKVVLGGKDAFESISAGSSEGGATAEKAGGNFIKGLFNPKTPIFSDTLGTTAGGVLGAVVAGAIWGAIVGGAVYALAGALGADKEQARAAGLASGFGTFAGVTYYGLFAEGSSIAGGASSLQVPGGGTFTAKILEGGVSWFGKTVIVSPFGAFVIGLAVAAVVFVVTYKDLSQKIVYFECLAWEAPLGGKDCELCNNDPLKPCSEYRCNALGQACQLVNKGTVEEKCVWINPNDVNAPTITPWQNAILEGYEYTKHDTLPPSLGTKIVRQGGGCIKPFTPLTFGIITNEPAQCKIDYQHTETIDNMVFYFENNNFFRNNHTQVMSLPSPEAINAEGPVIENSGEYDFYVRCQDANGNVNEQEFVFSFCVDDSPDTTPPQIIATSILDKSPVAFGSDEVPFSLFVNEPAECKWSIIDQTYETMENIMTCATKVTEQNAQSLYECKTTLTGIKDRQDNLFYFRCKDQPSKQNEERNVNVQSLEFTLRGSQELNIIKASPANETIKGSTDAVNVELFVETSNGAAEGEAVCFFSPSGEEGDYIAMFETNSFEHRQTLTLTAGNYDYFFRCVDAGGNADESSISFEVEIDNSPPSVTRAYRELDALKIVTDEDAECSYSLNSCNFVFEEGIALIYSNPSIKTNHFVE